MKDRQQKMTLSQISLDAMKKLPHRKDVALRDHLVDDFYVFINDPLSESDGAYTPAHVVSALALLLHGLVAAQEVARG